MNAYRSVFASAVAALLTAVYSPAAAQDEFETMPPDIPTQEQPEVLSRGPVHEAFAEPVILQAEGTLIAPTEPPQPIEEIPPAEKPHGNQFVWIPGYWSWDADQNEYIWVSACWRAAPPNMSWVPGYWAQVPEGWAWVSGLWAPTGVQDLEYLPEPPPIEDVEPVISSPYPDAIWVPPCMYWSCGRYLRRDGYWLAAQPNWIWVPAHYAWTPRGYIFVQGHWDYSIDRRGILYAPVRFPSPVYLRRGFFFSPGIVVDLGLLQMNLFTYPRYGHYYFGDYYDDIYLHIGIYPWFESRHYHIWYDPIYEHARWRHRSEPRWEQHNRDEYRRRCNNRDLRPAHTYREQEYRGSRLSESQHDTSRIVRSVKLDPSDRKTSIKFKSIDREERYKISKKAEEVNAYRNHRDRRESGDREHKPDQTDRKQQSTATDSSQHRKHTWTEKKEYNRQTPSTEQPKDNSQTLEPAIRPLSPSVKSRQTVQPRTRNENPPTSRMPAPVSRTKTDRDRSNKIQIPASPVVGGSGKQGFFHRGPPKQPPSERDEDRFEKQTGTFPKAGKPDDPVHR